MSQENIAIVDNTSKYYGEVVAVNQLSMTVKKGITGFVGPNGSGKSTTIKMMTGELKPASGRVFVLGENPYDNVALKRRIGYVSEHEAIYPWMTAEYFVYALTKITLSRAVAKKAAKDALKAVELWDVRARKCGTFSKGMKQRLKVAQALAHDPEFLIADEPLAGLDPLARNHLIQIFQNLTKEGKTILISSHVLHEVQKISEKVVLIYRGRSIAEGKIEEIRGLIDRHPHHIRVVANPLNKMAELLINTHPRLVKSVEFNFDRRTGQGSLTVLTHTPERFYSEIPKLTTENNIHMSYIGSQDDSLEAVFAYLVKSEGD
ncbi:MAG: ABC transporter ATP-binding protein [Candidatus Hodarchaeota archaeon]